MRLRSYFLKFFSTINEQARKSIARICQLLVQAANLQNSFYAFSNAEIAISSILFAINKTDLGALMKPASVYKMLNKKWFKDSNGGKGFISEENIADCYYAMVISYSSTLQYDPYLKRRTCLGNPKLSSLLRKRKCQIA